MTKINITGVLAAAALVLATQAHAQNAPLSPECQELASKAEELMNRGDQVCEKNDAASQTECAAIEKQLDELDQKAEQLQCGGADEGDQGEEDAPRR